MPVASMIRRTATGTASVAPAAASLAPFPYTCVVDEKKGRVYVSLWGANAVLVLDAATGARRWRTSYAADYTPQFGAGPGPRTSPVIDGPLVFTFGIKGTF